MVLERRGLHQRGARHSEDALGHDVALDLFRAAIHAGRTRPEIARPPAWPQTGHGVGPDHVQDDVLDLLDGGRPQQLGDRSLLARRAVGHAQRQLLDRVVVQDLADDVGPGQPLADDRVADQAALGGDVLQHEQLGTVAGQDPDVAGPSLIGQRPHGQLPARPRVADPVPDRDDDVVEGDLCGMSPGVGGLDPTGPDSGGLHVDEQDGDAAVLGRVGFGAREQEAPVGVGRSAGPQLGPVDDVVIAVEHGPGLERGQVRTAAGLAETLAPLEVPAHGGHDELFALLGSAGHHHDPLEMRHAQAGSTDRGGFGVEDRIVDGGNAAAAPLFRPGLQGVSRVEQQPAPVSLPLPGLLRLVDLLQGPAGQQAGARERHRAVLLQPRTRLGPVFRLFRGVAEIHRLSLILALTGYEAAGDRRSSRRSAMAASWSCTSPSRYRFSSTRRA